MTKLGNAAARLASWVFLFLATPAWPATGNTAAGGDEASREPRLELALSKQRVYPGEEIQVIVTLLVGQTPLRNIQYPLLPAAGFRLSEFGPPRHKAVEQEDQSLSAQEFIARLTPRESGEYQVGPARLSADILVPGAGAAAFFGGAEAMPLTLHSPVVGLQVLPLPRAGRPEGFQGAIGRFSVVREASPRQIQTGDPVTVVTTIRGTGDTGSFSCPSLGAPGVRAYPPRARRTANALACEQVLVPGSGNELLLPAFGISYFDPGAGAYGRASTGPVRIPISQPAPAPRATVPSVPPEAARQRPALVGQRDALAWGAGLATFAMLALGAYLAMRHRPAAVRGRVPPHQPQAQTWLAEARNALDAGDRQRFHLAVFRALQAHVGARCGLVPGAITVDAVRMALEPGGVPDPLLEVYETLFMTCDRERYAPPSKDEGGGMGDTFRLLQSVLRDP